jgi:hypothetical protein
MWNSKFQSFYKLAENVQLRPELFSDVNQLFLLRVERRRRSKDF